MLVVLEKSPKSQLLNLQIYLMSAWFHIAEFQ